MMEGGKSFERVDLQDGPNGSNVTTNRDKKTSKVQEDTPAVFKRTPQP